MATYPNTTSASDVWSLRDVYKAEAAGEWPGDPIYGTEYASSYLATTGGTLINHSSGSLNSVIDSASDGDAILLAEGTSYTIDATDVDGYDSDPFRGKNILICGGKSAEAVVVTVDHDGESAVRDHPIFVGYNSGHTPSVNKQMAFLTCKRLRTTSTNYSNALVNGNATQVPKGRMVNCYFDNNSGDIAWHYDNSSYTTIDVEFVRCTFANYGTWSSSYSGVDNVITVSNCLFDGTTDTTEYVNGGGNVTSATVNTTTRLYDTATYTTAGHLYVPNTTAVF